MKTLNIAIIGAGMIGAAHASGYRGHQARLANENFEFALHTICDFREEAAAELARVWGFKHTATKWEDVINNPEIDIVSVALPNFLHAQVSAAALRAGKHVLCEKPLALNANDACELVKIANESEVVCGSVFNYRRVPAVAMIKKFLDDGEIGILSHMVIKYESSYAADPMLPFSWRYRKSQAGGGALHDVGPHAMDVARFLAGDVSEIIGASSETVIPHRYVPMSANIGHSHVQLSDKMEVVDTDDITSCLMKFRDGCHALFTASRVSVGMGNTLTLQLTGTKGTIHFNSERPGEFQIARIDQVGGAFVTIANNPSFPYLNDWIPVPHDGVAIGYAESFGFMVAEFMQNIVNKKPGVGVNGFRDGFAVAEALEAIQRSVDEKRPVALNEPVLHGQAIASVV